MCAACAERLPAASKTAQEKSRRSRILGEKAARLSTAPISSQTASMRLAKTLSSMAP